jgi:hypothetical protein
MSSRGGRSSKRAREQEKDKATRKGKKKGTDSSSSSKKGKKDGKKLKGKKRKAASSSSSSTEDSDSSSSSEAETSTSSSSDETDSQEDSSGEERGKKAKKKKGKGSEVHWDLINEMWPLESRPKHLQKKKVVEKMELGELMKFKEHFEKEAEKKGLGAAACGMDLKAKKVKYKEQVDDSCKKLHPARFSRQPLVMPRKYWKKIPQKRAEIIRHFPLTHYGADGQVNEATVVKMHDRRVAVELDMLARCNFSKESRPGEKMPWAEATEVKHIQEAVLNFATMLHAIWPADYSGLVILRVLVEAKWGEIAGEEDKKRLALVKRFFGDTVRENASRAVRQQEPLDYEGTKLRWNKAVEAVLPQYSTFGNVMVSSGAGGFKQAAKGQGQKQSGAGKGSGRTGGGGLNTPAAAYNGVPVCYGFNTSMGCSRPKHGQNSCKNQKGAGFAHVCDWYDFKTKKHCLSFHSRVGNH